MRRFVPILLIAATPAQAQSWCPPGAQWNYDYWTPGIHGFRVHTYEGDTLIDGSIAQKLHVTGVRIWFPAPPDWDTTLLNYWHFTRTTGELVELLVNDDPPTWDTLHRFDAIPGDRWFPLYAEDFCDNGRHGMLLVSDTDHVVVDDLPLRRWSLNICDSAGNPMLQSGQELKVIERLGYLGGFEIPPAWCFVVWEGGIESLRCYSDNDIQPDAEDWPFGCASITSVDEHGTKDRIMPFPNPGTDHFSVQLPLGVHSIEVFDATGRCRMNGTSTVSAMSVSTGAWPPGIYTVLVRSDHGHARALRWVKE